MKTPSKFLVTRFKLLCVNITVLTGIDVDLDSDCHNHLVWRSHTHTHKAEGLVTAPVLAECNYICARFCDRAYKVLMSTV